MNLLIGRMVEAYTAEDQFKGQLVAMGIGYQETGTTKLSHTQHYSTAIILLANNEIREVPIRFIKVL